MVGVGDADRLAAEAFGHCDVIDAVDAEFGRVDVFERQLHLIIHVEAALRLADQAEVRVVHDDVHVRQFELRSDRKLLDEELEVIVARQRDDFAVRIGGAHAERGRQRPSQGARLPGIDPVARAIDAEELRAGNLREPDHADVTGVAAEGFGHLLIDALRLDRHVVKVALAQHRTLAVLARRRPGLTLPELAGFAPLLCDRDEQFEGRLGVGDDAEIGIEDAPNLCGLDIDVHEGAALGVGLDRTGVPVGPAVTDAEHEVGLQHGGVAVAMTGLQADHPRHQHVVVRNGAPPH